MSTGLLAAILGQGGGPPASPFPQILGTPASYNGAFAASHDVTLPSGIVSGELLLMIVRQGGINANKTPPSGWNLPSGTATGPLESYIITATGSEGATATVVPATARKLVAWTVRISPAATVEGVTANNTDPAALSPAWGADDTLWIAAASISQNDAVFQFTGSPTGFTQQTYLETTDAAMAGDTEDAQLIIALMEDNTATKDPSNFTNTGTQNLRRALTIAIQP